MLSRNKSGNRQQMSQPTAFVGARIFDGHVWHDDAALIEEGGRVAGIVPAAELPGDIDRVTLEGGMLVPGFVDLQVNGGGGVLFNNDISVEAIRTICAAHAAYGTTALLVTLITDVPEATERAIAAGRAAKGEVPGYLGLHLEGPHLSLARKGTHAPELIRPMEASDLDRIVAAVPEIANLLVTVAPESVTREQIVALARAGVHVSLGHTDASYEIAMASFEAGATMATHLFNAMSQLGNREPGVVGAVIDSPDIYAGLIADGIHVHSAAIRTALRAKADPGRVFLVTDSMSQTGTGLTEFALNGRTVYRADGALRLADGTLAGADLDMIDAVWFAAREGGAGLDEALRMASLYPARAMGLDAEYGHLGVGARSDFVHIDEADRISAVFISGKPVHPRPI
jgi:N-acetylglucosamine-6-phosphate deacetylase